MPTFTRAQQITLGVCLTTLACIGLVAVAILCCKDTSVLTLRAPELHTWPAMSLVIEQRSSSTQDWAPFQILDPDKLGHRGNPSGVRVNISDLNGSRRIVTLYCQNTVLARTAIAPETGFVAHGSCLKIDYRLRLELRQNPTAQSPL